MLPVRIHRSPSPHAPRHPIPDTPRPASSAGAAPTATAPGPGIRERRVSVGLPATGLPEPVGSWEPAQSRAAVPGLDLHPATGGLPLARAVQARGEDLLARTLEMANRQHLTGEGLTRAIGRMASVNMRYPLVRGEALGEHIARLGAGAVDFSNPAVPATLAQALAALAGSKPPACSWGQCADALAQVPAHARATPQLEASEQLVLLHRFMAAIDQLARASGGGLGPGRVELAVTSLLGAPLFSSAPAFDAVVQRMQPPLGGSAHARMSQLLNCLQQVSEPVQEELIGAVLAHLKGILTDARTRTLDLGALLDALPSVAQACNRLDPGGLRALLAPCLDAGADSLGLRLRTQILERVAQTLGERLTPALAECLLQALAQLQPDPREAIRVMNRMTTGEMRSDTWRVLSRQVPTAFWRPERVGEIVGRQPQVVDAQTLVQLHQMMVAKRPIHQARWWAAIAEAWSGNPATPARLFQRGVCAVAAVRVWIEAAVAEAEAHPGSAAACSRLVIGLMRLPQESCTPDLLDRAATALRQIAAMRCRTGEGKHGPGHARRLDTDALAREVAQAFQTAEAYISMQDAAAAPASADATSPADLLGPGFAPAGTSRAPIRFAWSADAGVRKHFQMRASRHWG